MLDCNKRSLPHIRKVVAQYILRENISLGIEQQFYQETVQELAEQGFLVNRRRGGVEISFTYNEQTYSEFVSDSVWVSTPCLRVLLLQVAQAILTKFNDFDEGNE